MEEKKDGDGDDDDGGGGGGDDDGDDDGRLLSGRRGQEQGGSSPFIVTARKERQRLLESCGQLITAEHRRPGPPKEEWSPLSTSRRSMTLNPTFFPWAGNGEFTPELCPKNN